MFELITMQQLTKVHIYRK